MILALFQMRISNVGHLEYAEAERIVALRLQCMDCRKQGGLLGTSEAFAAQRIRHLTSCSLGNSIAGDGGSVWL